jgi:cysteine desulfurase / selenocysteine lyase
MIDWNNTRKTFPVTERQAYLNTAAAGPLSHATRDAATRYYDLMMADGDSHWDKWLEQREAVRRRVAEFIKAEPDEIGLTINTSSGMNVIVDALEGRGEVISCELEFPVSTIPWIHRQIPVHLVKTPNGELSTEVLLGARTSKSKIFSVSYVQFSNGCRLDLEELGDNKGDHLLVVNASQAAGAFEIDVKRMKIDALCATGHKWMLSGYGSGFVYLSRELLSSTKPRAIGWLSANDPYGDKNDQVNVRNDAAARVELGCPHFAGMFALGASIEQMMDIGRGRIQERVLHLNKTLTERLTEAGWKVLSPLREEKFRSAETLVAAEHPGALVAHLASRRVAVTEKPEGIRVATHFFNNEDDIEALMDGLSEF